MSLREFADSGYLQEANRLLFHRLGLALTFSRDTDTGEVTFVGFQDWRDDPEGCAFSRWEPGDDLRAQRIADELAAKDQVRQESFGWTVQPVGAELPVEVG